VGSCRHRPFLGSASRAIFTSRSFLFSKLGKPATPARQSRVCATSEPPPGGCPHPCGADSEVVHTGRPRVDCRSKVRSGRLRLVFHSRPAFLSTSLHFSFYRRSTLNRHGCFSPPHTLDLAPGTLEFYFRPFIFVHGHPLCGALSAQARALPWEPQAVRLLRRRAPQL
jgi:hypothetical protein